MKKRINTYYGKDFDLYTHATSECQLNFKKVDINGRLYAFNIWDTIGQEQYHATIFFLLKYI